MPTWPEQLPYLLAKRLYRSEAAHSAAMKEAVSDRDKYRAYRASRIDFLCPVLRRLGIDLRDRVVLDLGCGDGALSERYLGHGARRVIGVDIDERAVEAARALRTGPGLEFRVGRVDGLPLPDGCVDAVVCYDVFEHVSRPAVVLAECRRVLRPGGRMLIGTWGWYHPYAPHLWSTMPVPWAHVFFSERTLIRVCRRVYDSPWYVPTMHDLDEKGNKREDRFLDEGISPDYLNKLLIRDFERLFRASGLAFRVHPEPFGSRYARWTRVFLRVPWVREFITAYLWVVLEKPARA